METAKEILYYSFMVFYALVLCFSIIRYQDYKHTPLRLLPVIFFFTFITEYTGAYVYGILGVPNQVIYNIYYLFHFGFFLFVFMRMVNDRVFKNNILMAMGVFVGVFFADLIFTDVYRQSFVWTYLAGSLFLVYSIVLYYIDILESPRVLVVKNDLLFWVSVGLFLFYIGYIPIKILKAWFFTQSSFFGILYIIHYSLIVVMYLCFLIGFLWMKRKS